MVVVNWLLAKNVEFVGPSENKGFGCMHYGNCHVQPRIYSCQYFEEVDNKRS